MSQSTYSSFVELKPGGSAAPKRCLSSQMKRM
jgi:hypothetical protein